MKSAFGWIGAMVLCVLAGCGSSSFPGSSEQAVYPLDAPFQPRYTGQLSSRGRWSTRTIRVAFSQGAETRPLGALRPAMEREILRWAVATNGLVRFSFSEEPTDAEVRIAFVDATDPDLPRSSGEQAITDLQWIEDTPRNALRDARVKIRVGLAPAQVGSIAAHEIGHALGITGHSDDPKDLMAARIAVGTPVSRRDASTLAFLYLSDDRD